MPLPPTIESDLKYCPRCGDEYRAEIATCAACRCDLLSGRQVLAALVRQADAAAPAANEPGVTVEADIFGMTVVDTLTVQAELAEAVWVDPLHPGDLVLAPLTRDHVLPLAVPAS